MHDPNNDITVPVNAVYSKMECSHVLGGGVPNFGQQMVAEG